jgi:hypothetical protein
MMQLSLSLLHCPGTGLTTLNKLKNMILSFCMSGSASAFFGSGRDGARRISKLSLLKLHKANLGYETATTLPASPNRKNTTYLLLTRGW